MASSDDIKKPERSADSESFASAPTLEQAKLNDDKYVSPLPLNLLLLCSARRIDELAFRARMNRTSSVTLSLPLTGVKSSKRLDTRIATASIPPSPGRLMRNGNWSEL